MLEAYKKFFTNYANFKGCSSRSDFWYVVLCNYILVPLVIGVVCNILHLNSWAVEGIYGLIILIPSLAITVRRLHDANKSGACILLVLIPMVGWIIQLVFLCSGSVMINNEYRERV